MMIILLSSFQRVYLQDYVLCFKDTNLGRNLQRQMCGCLLHRGERSTGLGLLEGLNFMKNTARRPRRRRVTLLLPGGVAEAVPG